MSQQTVENYCDRSARRRKRKSNTLWTSLTRKRRYHEYYQSTWRRNWEPRTIKNGSIRITVNSTSFKYTQWQPRYYSKTTRQEDRYLQWIQWFKWYRRKQRIVTRRYSTYFRTKTPETTIANEKEGGSDHLENDDFIPNHSINRSSSEENIAEFNNEMDTSTLQGLQQTITELQ